MPIPKEIRDLMTDEEIRTEKQRELTNDVFISDMRDLMKDIRCQKLLIFLLDISNINGNNYTGDNNATNFNLGRSSMGYSLLELMEQVDPTMYPRLLLKFAKEKTK